MKKPNLKDQLARALADYDNLRKRVEREREDLGKIVSLRLVLRLLTVLDNLRLAQKHLQDSGLAITITEFENIFKEEGIEEIQAEVGQVFDAGLHEAVEVVVKDKGKEGKIAEVVLSGWKFQDGPVIRHAKVKVAKAIPSEVEG